MSGQKGRRPPEGAFRLADRLARESVYKGRESRQDQRHKLTVEVEVQPVNEDFEPVGELFVAVTQDISTGGLGLIHTSAVDDRYLCIALRDDLWSAYEGKVFVLEVVRCDPVGPLYAIGGKFVAKIDDPRDQAVQQETPPIADEARRPRRQVASDSDAADSSPLMPDAALQRRVKEADKFIPSNRVAVQSAAPGNSWLVAVLLLMGAIGGLLIWAFMPPAKKQAERPKATERDESQRDAPEQTAAKSRAVPPAATRQSKSRPRNTDRGKQDSASAAVAESEFEASDTSDTREPDAPAPGPPPAKASTLRVVDDREDESHVANREDDASALDSGTSHPAAGKREERAGPGRPVHSPPAGPAPTQQDAVADDEAAAERPPIQTGPPASGARKPAIPVSDPLAESVTPPRDLRREASAEGRPQAATASPSNDATTSTDAVAAENLPASDEPDAATAPLEGELLGGDELQIPASATEDPDSSPADNDPLRLESSEEPPNPDGEENEDEEGPGASTPEDPTSPGGTPDERESPPDQQQKNPEAEDDEAAGEDREQPSSSTGGRRSPRGVSGVSPRAPRGVAIDGSIGDRQTGRDSKSGPRGVGKREGLRGFAAAALRKGFRRSPAKAEQKKASSKTAQSRPPTADALRQARRPAVGRGRVEPKQDKVKSSPPDTMPATAHHPRTTAELEMLYYMYAEMKGWSTSKAAVQEKVKTWEQTKSGSVGLAIRFFETGIDGASGVGRNAEDTYKSMPPEYWPIPVRPKDATNP